ncbi:hypothetical protein CMUS01_13227 [Colletotrichum musicola]|uniref:Alpha beta hydrolase fold protein n=1 Tax=Colletotrichum musicola TaxID=2175873 RepID=A0A8H6JFI0_9PEZI|nr:hypothetical protein CMUS01_13227 [Colletotrichum musicola]
MPDLDEISYSQEETIAAVRDYYHFLAKMYLPDSLVMEPPEGGWPGITHDNLGAMKKTDEVIELLRHLSYIRNENDGVNEAHAAPRCHFANSAATSTQVAEGRTNAEDLKLLSEGVDTQDNVPSHVVGLMLGGRDNPIILLDTELGTVHWLECPGEIRYEPLCEQVSDDPYEYAPEEEAEWRVDAPAWAVADFFEELKARFRELDFVPIGPREVRDTWTPEHPTDKGLLDLVRGVYREHHWPDIEQFDKQTCQEALRFALKDRYPDQVW